MCIWAILLFVGLFLQDLSSAGGCGMSLIPQKERFYLAGLVAVPRSPRQWHLLGEGLTCTSTHTTTAENFSQKPSTFPSLGCTFPKENFSYDFTFSTVRMCQVWQESNCLILNYPLYSPSSLPASLRKANPAEVGEQEESRIFPRKRFFF